MGVFCRSTCTSLDVPRGADKRASELTETGANLPVADMKQPGVGWTWLGEAIESINSDLGRDSLPKLPPN